MTAFLFVCVLIVHLCFITLKRFKRTCGASPSRPMRAGVVLFRFCREEVGFVSVGCQIDILHFSVFSLNTIDNLLEVILRSRRKK